MDHVGEGTGRVERAYVAPMQGDPARIRQMRQPGREAVRVPGEHERGDVGAETVVGPAQRFQQPRADEARAAGDQHARAAQVPPERLGAREDVRAIGLERLGPAQRRHHDRMVSTTKSSIGGVRPG